MITEKARLVYKNISLFDRYKSLSEKFNSENTLENYDRIEVAEIFYNQNCDFKYDKKESFFGLTEEADGFEFKLNVSLKYGVVESILWSKSESSSESYGGPVSRLVKQVQIAEGIKEVERIPYPRFASVSELKDIISEIYSMYKDFKVQIVESHPA